MTSTSAAAIHPVLPAPAATASDRSRAWRRRSVRGRPSREVREGGVSGGRGMAVGTFRRASGTGRPGAGRPGSDGGDRGAVAAAPSLAQGERRPQPAGHGRSSRSRRVRARVLRVPVVWRAGGGCATVGG